MKHVGRIVITLTVLAGLIGGGLWANKQREAQNPETRYKLATLEKGDVTQTVSANGTLNPVVLISVGTQVSGTVRKLYVDFNDKVKKVSRCWNWMMRWFPPPSGKVPRMSSMHRPRWSWLRPTRRG